MSRTQLVFTLAGIWLSISAGTAFGALEPSIGPGAARTVGLIFALAAGAIIATGYFLGRRP